MSSPGDRSLKPKYYPSSAAFATGYLVHTTYNSGCIRKIYLANEGVRESLPADVQRVGAENEERFGEKLAQKGLKYTRESAVKSDDGPVTFSGRTDYQTDNEVIELKSTRSKSKRTALRAGRVPVENVAQLVAYMLETQKISGRLIYTYFNEDKGTTEDYEFWIRIGGEGQIYMNDREYPFNVFDHLRHRVLVASMHTSRSGSDPSFGRPVGHDRPFDSPCHFCPFKGTCEKFDKTSMSTLEQFVTEARKAITK